MSMTINECAETLSERLMSFSDFRLNSDEIWSDVSAVQKALVSVESLTRDLETTESGYAVQMTQAGELFAGATKRASDLNSWINGEKVLRNQLTDLFTDLDKKVLNTSDQVLLTSSSIRDALIQMQKVHDHATNVLTAVGDAETYMYEWAFNVSQAVNRHTVNLVTVAQTLQYRSSQVDSVQNANTQLNWIVSQLYNKYGAEKLAKLNKEYEDGSLSTPLGTAMGPNTISTTGGQAVGPLST
jgi:DNA repair ATPase RecN